MKEHPILFSTPMVRALLEGRKTMTRRVLKKQDIRIHPLEGWPGSSTGPVKCPYGKVGDVLWVKELHYRYGHWQKNGLSNTGRQKWKFMPDNKFTQFRYFDNPPEKVEKNSHRAIGWYRRSSLFMPRSACRIFLEITHIKVERLQDITEEDAIAEGIEKSMSGNGRIVWKHYTKDKWGPSPVHSYETLWRKINGQESWDADPWVWVIEFKRIENAYN